MRASARDNRLPNRRPADLARLSRLAIHKRIELKVPLRPLGVDVIDDGRPALSDGVLQDLPDRRVHLVAEGDADELERFVAAIERVMRGNVADRETLRGPASGEFVGFSIVR